MSDDAWKRHEKTLSWHDPKPSLDALPAMSGMEFLRGVMTGELPAPPMAVLMGMRLVEIESGSIVFECVPGDEHFNLIGVVHGGYACTLLDSAIGCAVQTMLPAGAAATSIEIKVSYLRPVLPSSAPLRAIGTVTKPGRRVSFAEAVLNDAQGRTVATASGSALIFDAGDIAKPAAGS